MRQTTSLKRSSLSFLSYLLVALSFTLIAGCTRFSTPADLTFINGAEPETLDPAILTGQPEGRIASSLFEGLLTRNAKGELLPGIAEKWEISPDGTTYTFFLRTSQWSNGDPVTAHDFEYSWKRVLNPETASQYAELLYFLKNAEDYHEGNITDASQVGIRALDPSTLQVELTHPTPFFLELCAFTTFLPVHQTSIERHGENFIKPGFLISNGPYLLDQWYMNDRIRLKANPYYWRPHSPHLASIDILPTDDPSSAFNTFYTGRADLIAHKDLIPAELIEAIREKPWFHPSPILATYFYRFNVTRPPFHDPKVRKALALAINKQQLINKITKNGEPIASTLTPPQIAQGTYLPPEGLAYNPTLAQKLLAEAGFPHGQGFPRFSILYNTNDLNKEIAIEIQTMWRNTLGIEATLRNQEWKVYLNTLSLLDYDVARSSWVGDYNDPTTFLDCFVTDRGNNRTGWSNLQYDALLEQAYQTLNPQKRMHLLHQAEAILVEKDLPLIPLYYFVTAALFDPQKITGFSPNLLDEHPLRELKKK